MATPERTMCLGPKKTDAGQLLPGPGLTIFEEQKRDPRQKMSLRERREAIEKAVKAQTLEKHEPRKRGDLELHNLTANFLWVLSGKLSQRNYLPRIEGKLGRTFRP